MRWQIRNEEGQGLDDSLGVAPCQIRKARRGAVRGAARIREAIAGSGCPFARNASSEATGPLSGFRQEELRAGYRSDCPNLRRIASGCGARGAALGFRLLGRTKICA